jgi:hypothetical protein
MRIRFFKFMLLSLISSYTSVLTALPAEALKKKEPQQALQAKKENASKRSSSSSSSSSSDHRGRRGHRGKKGHPGPQGASGECPCDSSFLSVFTTTTQTIPPGDTLIFDEFAVDVQGLAMTYNKLNGVVTFHETGFYEVTFGAQVLLQFPQNDEFGILLTPGGVQGGSALIYTLPFSDLMDSITVIVEATSVNQTLQIVNLNTPVCGALSPNNIVTDTQTACTTVAPVVAYLVITKLS